MSTQPATLTVGNAQPTTIVHVPQVSGASVPTVTTNPNAYVKLEDESGNSEFKTKYDMAAWFIMFVTALFFLAWIGWIVANWFMFGLTRSYCKKPTQTCINPAVEVPECCSNGYGSLCWDSYTLECLNVSTTISPFLIQLLLIPLLILYIFMLVRAPFQSISIITPETPSHPLIQKLVEFKERITVDLRPWLWKEKEHPQKSAIDFLWNGLIALSVFRLIEDLPIILFNMAQSTSPTLQAVGKVKLWADIGNIAMNIYAAYAPCCNVCRGKCCGDSKCPCDCCFDIIGCRCMFGHFPEHHIPYVRSLASIISFSCLLKTGAATAQVGAVGFVDSTDELHLWMIGLNFVYGIVVIVNVYQLKWRYYYLMCFYWSRWAVNKHENYKIHELLNGLLKGGYLFRVKVEEEDQFITVLETEHIAPRVDIKFDCWVFVWATYMLFVLIGVATLFWNSTLKFNQDFNLDYRLFG